MSRSIVISALFAGLLPGIASALELSFDADAKQIGVATTELGAFAMPVSTFENGKVMTRPLQGRVQASSWNFPLEGRTTGNIMDSLRAQLAGQGYTPLLDCVEQDCGGFDFRYSLDLLPEPKMHVDLGDYRFLSAFKAFGEGKVEYLQLVVSRSQINAFVQMTTVGQNVPEEKIVAATKTPNAVVEITNATDSLADELWDQGFASLRDLTFATGSSDLTDGEFLSLDALGAFLAENSDLTVALVGHTDAVGSLAANVGLSKRRAQAVLERLVSRHGIERRRLEADGVGYLSPVATNLSEEGRAKNRRVEVIITSTR